MHRRFFCALSFLLGFAVLAFPREVLAERIAAPQWHFSIGHGPLPRPWFDNLPAAVAADNEAFCQQCTSEVAPYGGWCTDCRAENLRFDYQGGQVPRFWAGDGYRTYNNSWPPGRPPQTVGPDIGRASGAVEIRCPIGYFYDDRGFCWADDTVVVREELGGQCAKGSCCFGNPIDPGSLRKLQVEADYVSPNEPLLTVKRYYNSAAYSGSSSLGALWRHEFDARIGALGEAATIAQGVFYGLLTATPTSYVTAPVRRSSLSANPIAFGFAQLTLIRPSGAVVRAKAEGTEWTDPERRAFSVRAGAGGNSRWVLRDHAANVVEEYTDAGRLTKRSSHDGRHVNLNYDAGARLLSVSDQSGRYLQYRYDTSARISEVLLSSGAGIHYQYDGPTQHVPIGWSPQSALTQVTYVDGWRRLYHYNEPTATGNNIFPKAMTGVSEEIAPDIFSRLATYTYVYPGWPTSTSYAGGANRYSINYPVPYQQVAVTDPLGTVRTQRYTTALGSVLRASTDQPAGSGCGPSSASLHLRRASQRQQSHRLQQQQDLLRLRPESQSRDQASRRVNAAGGVLHRIVFTTDRRSRHQHAMASRLAARDTDRGAEEAHHHHLQRAGCHVRSKHRPGRRQTARSDLHPHRTSHHR